MKKIIFGVLIFISFLPSISFALEPNILAITASQGDAGTTTYSLSLKILAIMTVMTVLPALLMTVTSFTRVIIVLAILRQALGMPNVPTNQILIGLSILVTLFIMSPVFNQVNETALQPYLSETIDEKQAIQNAITPFKTFMIKQTRQDDLDTFIKMSKTDPNTSIENISLPVIMTSFITSELKTAFQIGFILFVPFLIIDLVVSSILMSMGMMMLSPMIISLPFKIMLFVLINGWTLIIGTLSSSFSF